jgi:glycosyltransferase involved in cell wall biosynthesis
LIASSVDAPLVVTAHGRDVRNIGSVPGITALTRRVVRHASAVIAVSEYLRRELELRLPEAQGKTVVIDSGVDLDRFRPSPERSQRGNGVSYLAIGTLSARKNVVRLADAFERLESGRLTFVGDGPLRSSLEGRDRVHLAGRVPHEEVPRFIDEADVVCAPSLLEPLGQSILEAMAAGKTVVATRFGGPAEFVPPGAGILVDPLDVGALARALEDAATFPSPNEAARNAAAKHDVRLQAERVEDVLIRAEQARRV